MTPATLRTTRLTLRALGPQHTGVIASTLNDYEISKWLSHVPYPYTVDDAAWFINENAEGRFQARSIWHDDNFVGVIGIDGELGYWLAQSAWGRGYATEAARATITNHFAVTDADTICSSHFAENTASQSVLEKLGFVDVGAHTHFSKARNAEVSARRMKLTRIRWDSLDNA